MNHSVRPPKIFIPYYPFGYPTLPLSIDILETLAKNGADALEIGMSFSDPLADGPVIQHATQIALSNGVTVKKTFEAVEELRRRNVTIPLYLMGYYNPILAYGVKNFIQRVEHLKISGLIIPDLPLEEANDLIPFLDQSALIRMISPTTPYERVERLATGAKGFIYLVGMTGVTGSGREHSKSLGQLVTHIRNFTDIPICVGFGVSDYQKARQVSEICDGVVVGTKIIKEVESAEDKVSTAMELAQGFKKAIQGK